MAAAGEFCKQLLCAPFLFLLFLKNSSYSSLLLQTSPWPLAQLNSPDWGLSRSGPITAQLFPAIHSLSRRTSPLCVCRFILISPSDFNHPGPSWWCSNLPVWQGREPLTWLSSKNPVVDPWGAGPGAAATLVLVLLPGTLLPQTNNLLTVEDFSMSSPVLTSNLHICWDTIGCALCSSEDRLGVLPMRRGKWTLLPPISPPSLDTFFFKSFCCADWVFLAYLFSKSLI